MESSQGTGRIYASLVVKELSMHAQTQRDVWCWIFYQHYLGWNLYCI